MAYNGNYGKNLYSKGNNMNAKQALAIRFLCLQQGYQMEAKKNDGDLELAARNLTLVQIDHDQRKAVSPNELATLAGRLMFYFGLFHHQYQQALIEGWLKTDKDREEAKNAAYNSEANLYRIYADTWRSACC